MYKRSSYTTCLPIWYQSFFILAFLILLLFKVIKQRSYMFFKVFLYFRDNAGIFTSEIKCYLEFDS